MTSRLTASATAFAIVATATLAFAANVRLADPGAPAIQTAQAQRAELAPVQRIEIVMPRSSGIER